MFNTILISVLFFCCTVHGAKSMHAARLPSWQGQSLDARPSFLKAPADMGRAGLAHDPDIAVDEFRIDSRTANNQSRAAVIIRGLSFRAGGQYSIDEHDDDNMQLNATDSQISNLIIPLEKIGYMVDVFSATQTATRDPTLTDKLMAKFGTRLRSDRRVEPWPVGRAGQANTLAAAANAVSSYANESNVPYELVVVIRHDMQFKHDRVASAIHSKIDKFTAPFKLIKNFRREQCKHRHGQTLSCRRVPDTMQTMPWRLFSYFLEHGIFDNHHEFPAHNIWRVMEPALPNNGAEMDFLYPHEYADSDPEKVSNSLYRFPQRGEGVRCDQAAEVAEDPTARDVCLYQAREKYCSDPDKKERSECVNVDA